MSKSSKIFLFIFSILASIYIVYNCYLRVVGNIETTLAVTSTAYDTVVTDCFVVRDEIQGSEKENKAIITNDGSGVYIPYVENGSRVGFGDTIALFFNSTEEAKLYKEKKALEADLAYYQKLQNQSKLSGFDLDKLQNEVDSQLDSYIASIENEDFAKSNELMNELKYNISSVKIALGEKPNYEAKIKQIEKEIKNLTGSGLDYKTIKATLPGYYINTVDGYEEVCDINSVSSLTKKGADEILQSDPRLVKDNVIGKIVSDFNWYLVCNIPQKLASGLDNGKELAVTFENTDISDLKMKVVWVSVQEDGYCALILESNEMNPSLSVLRKEKARIKVNTYTGLKIPKSTLRTFKETTKDKNGVEIEKPYTAIYVLYGKIVKLKKVDVIHYEEDFVIASNELSSDNEVKLYDMIITKGRNLYDGKLIY